MSLTVPDASAVERDDRDQAHVRLLLSFLLAPNSNCVDIGAYVGLVLAEMLRVAPRGRHIAFEPLADHAADLRRRYPQVDVRGSALSDRPGRVTFYRVRDAPALSGMRPRDHGDPQLNPSPIRTESLDGALPTGYVPTLIKIDVEGAEELVLLGAERTLATHRPVVILEHGAAAHYYGTTSTRVFQLLAAAGLRVFDIEGNGPYDADGMERVVATDRLWTWVAHP